MRSRTTSGKPGAGAGAGAGGMDAAARAPEEERRRGPEEERAPATKRLFVCAECTHAQLFAMRPLAVCTHERSCSRGRVLYAGRPACEQVLPRNGSQGAASWYKQGDES
jgi:hypothetical protein